MSGLTDEVLEKIEKDHSDGIPSATIVTLLEDHGVKFSEATLRKYVQLGLLPHSVRVGRKGQHRGSQGLYPASIVRQIVAIKDLLSQDYSIEEIRTEFLLLGGEIEAIEQKLGQVFEQIEAAVKSRPDDTVAERARRDLKDARATAEDLVAKLRALEARLQAPLVLPARRSNRARAAS